MKFLKSFNFNKIIFFTLICLFTLELFNIGFENSWDNYFTITSNQQSIHYISYALQSFMFGLHYYTGGWILLYLFLLFIILYIPSVIQQFSLKEKMIFSLFSFTYLVFHSAIFSGDKAGILLGDGLNHLIRSLMGLGGLIFCIIILNLSIVYFFLVRFSLWKFSLGNLVAKSSFPANQQLSATVQAYQPPHMIQPSPRNNLHYSQKSVKKDASQQMTLDLEDLEDLDETENKKEVEFDLQSDHENNPKTEERFFKKLSRSDEENKRLLDEYIQETSSQLESSSPDAEYFQSIKKILEEKLAEFKITGTIINVLKGPVVDTFELELGAGVKVSRVGSASEDLSLALSGAPIRIVFPLKGKSTVGIEVPRSPREIIYLTELLKSNEFLSNRLRIPLVIGKNAFGEPVVEDLASMPHMLVAGATGAGKSVFINSVLVSLLVRLDHEKLKLILIDPKQLELSLYAKLKHLLLPVMTTPSLASCALLWATEEMERRYSLMSHTGVRNIDGYNAKIINGTSPGEVLPYIVVVVDEFADLILSKHGKDIETNICRLAAKARASGIHLLLATQRPSVDVITGLIKSNFPTRVSFRVTSSIDSRTILNATGAENLLGMGDMLYKTGVETFRVHSPYIHEDEIDKIVSYLSSDEPTFDPGVMEFIEEKEEEITGSSGSKSANEGDYSSAEELEDTLLKQAIEIVLQYKAASASMLQRRLKIGYNRAANLVEIMEKRGIVGPQQGAKPRRVIIQDLPQD